MEKSRLKRKGLDFCFVDFKKVFDVVPHKHLSRRMEELGVSSEYMLSISQIYKNVICCVCMGDTFSKKFNITIRGTIRVKQGCPF